MNPLALLPLLAAAAMAAPGVLLASQPAAITYTAQVPLTQHIHYEHRPVVTGYQTTVVKPAIASAPLAVAGIPSHIVYGRQLPELTPPPADFPTLAPPNSTTLAPPGDAPTLPGAGAITPPTTTQAPNNETSTSGDMGNNPTLPIPGSPIVSGTPGLFQVVNPVQLQYSSLAIPQTLTVQPALGSAVVQARSVAVAPAVATVRAAQAGDFGPLVTKEKVLAPVRTHTQITPQLTQIQPEITVRKIVHDVPVATPVAVHTPVIHQQVAALPALQSAQIIHA